VPRQCKAFAIDFLSAILIFGSSAFNGIRTAEWCKRNGLTLPKTLKQSANSRQNLPAALRRTWQVLKKGENRK
jgi:hypothetical protein